MDTREIFANVNMIDFHMLAIPMATLCILAACQNKLEVKRHTGANEKKNMIQQKKKLRSAALLAWEK